MSIRSTKPLEGNRSPIQDWKYLEVPNAGSAVGFLAGQPLGLYCHTVNRRSKPCRLITTDGALSCPLCQAGRPAWRGFTPLYDREYTRRFVCITEDYLESVSEIETHAQVKLTRSKHQTSPIIIRAEQWRPSPLPPNEERKQPVDMLPCLLRMWKDEDLAKWHRTTDIPVSQAPASRCAAVPVMESRAQYLARRYQNWCAGTTGPLDADEVAELKDMLPLLEAQYGKPNGKHKKK